MGAVDCLIFSKDRGCQLDLLLRSIDLYARRLYRRVLILWTASDPGLADGYRLLQQSRWGAALKRQRDFDTDVRDWLAVAGDTVSFLVDDDVFYRDAPPVGELPWSLRGGDYDYPFSLDGNVYERDHVAKLVELMPPFRNPSELEAFGHELRHLLPFARVNPSRPACLVGVPLNRVSESSAMPHMGVDVHKLNRRFLAGERLALPKGRWYPELPAHAELELRWEQARAFA